MEFNLTGEEQSYLINKQPIKMCISADWTPFEKLDKDNKYIGLGADYYSIIEKNLSTKFELIKTKTPSEALNFIKDDKCDFLSLAVRTPRMESELNLSSTIFKIPLVIATKLNVPFVNKLEDLKNQKIAVPRKYINIDFFKNKYSNLDIVEVENAQEGLKLLKEGKVYGFVGTLYTVSYRIQTEYFNDLKIAGKISDELEFVVGVKKNDEILLSILQKSINNIDSLQMKELMNKWAFTIYEKTVDYTLVWQIIVPFILIFIFGMFFYTKLKLLNGKLSDQKKFINTILDIQPNMIFIVNKTESVFANKFLLDFFDCKNLKEFQQRYLCLAQTFIQEELFFHLGKIDDNSTWIENILKLKSEKRIVSILLPTTNTTKAFNVSIVELEDEQYLISLTDISDTILKQIQLEDKSTHDKLTGAFNREYFESHKNLIINEYTKENHLLIFSILDIDFFKKVNDTYGHDIGDKVLKQFVQIIQNSSRNDDLVIRWGGEEFILLLKINSIDNAKKVLENIRKTIAQTSFEKVEHITCSIGATVYKENETIEDSFKRADKALYEAKNSGRNKVVIKN